MRAVKEREVRKVAKEEKAFQMGDVTIYAMVGDVVRKKADKLIEELKLGSMKDLITKLIEDKYQKEIG